MVNVNGFHNHLCRFSDLVGGDLVRVGELLDYSEGLLLSDTWGFIAELIEVYEGLGYRENKGGVVSRRGSVSTIGVRGVRSPIWGI